MNETYKTFCRSTAKYPQALTGDLPELMYLALGLAGESGEIAGNVAKMFRDLEGDNGDARRLKIIFELGDVLWYFTRLCDALGVSPAEVEARNVAKLMGRTASGNLGGDGDNR